MVTLGAGVLLASPVHGQDKPGAAVVSPAAPAPVTERAHTPAGSGIKVRAAQSVVLSVSQQCDSPKDRDNKYEDNYVSTVYLKGSMRTGAPGYRSCSSVRTIPHAD